MINKKHKQPATKKKAIEHPLPEDPEFGAIGKRIKEIREKRGISQRELAKMCNVDRAILSRMEAGESEPSLKTLRLLASGLKTTPSALLAKEETELSHALNLAILEHQLKILIEKQVQALDVSNSLLADIQTGSKSHREKQSLESDPLITTFSRQVDLSEDGLQRTFKPHPSGRKIDLED